MNEMSSSISEFDVRFDINVGSVFIHLMLGYI